MNTFLMLLDDTSSGTGTAMATFLGYLFLAIAVLAGATKGYCSKKTSDIVHSTSNVSLMNAVRMMFCIVIGFALVLIFSKGFGGFVIDWQSALICLFSGFTTSFFIITWIICVRKSAYSMLNIFLFLSTLIPVVLCHFIWGEEVTVFKIIGFVVLLGAIVFMWIYSNKVKGKFSVRDIILLFVCAVFNGASSFAQKWRFYTCKETLSVYTFNFYTYLFGMAILLIAYLVFRLIERNKSEKSGEPMEKFHLKSIFWYVLILSVCLFANSLFYTMSAEKLPSSVLYPLSNGMGLVISMLLGHFCFSEKINKYSIIGICIAIVSFVFMVL